MFEYDLEVYGYSGQLIDDHVFKTKKDAADYVIAEYGGDGGIHRELYMRDVNSGVRTMVNCDV